MTLINLKAEKMRNLFIILLLVTGSLVSCTEDETGNVSVITNFPTFTMNGESVEFTPQGVDWIDPGVTATEDGAELPVLVEAVGTYMRSIGPTVDTNTADIYEVFYSAENSDGFSGSTVRTVWVEPPSGDLTTSLSGLYSADIQRAPSFTPGPPYEDLVYIIISKSGDNTYKLSHAVGDTMI